MNSRAFPRITPPASLAPRHNTQGKHQKIQGFSALLFCAAALSVHLSAPVFAADSSPASPSASTPAQSIPATAAHAPTDPATQDLITKGRYVAAAADCAACHTAPAPGSAPLAGGYPFALPFGTLYASNITPDPAYGIGKWTEAQFVRAIREGVRPDGTSLYPVMPYPSYARMTDADLHALYVYIMHSVQPVAQAPQANTIRWPFSLRFPLTLWRWMFAPSPEAARASAERSFASPELARGAYLVEGPGHCGACHTARGMAMQELALTAQDGPRYLAGGAAVDDWTPPSLRGEPRTGLGAWSEADLTAFLRTGRTTRGSAFGTMEMAVHHGTQYLTDDDLTAMARYLKTLPPADTTEQPWQADSAASHALLSGSRLTQGQKLYLDNCAACHRSTGAGYAPAFPPLAGNPVVMNRAPDSIIHIILHGATLHGTDAAPSAFTMPGFASRLTDAQVAALATFIRQAWGNNAPAVNDVAVTRMRKTLAAPSPHGSPEENPEKNTVTGEAENGIHPPMDAE